MKGVILAGGNGTRLNPVTGVLPKALVPVGGVFCIWHNVKDLVQAGIWDIIVVTSPCKAKMIRKSLLDDDLQKHFSKFLGLDSRSISFEFALQEEPAGDGHATCCALPFLKEEHGFVQVFADTLFDTRVGKDTVAAQVMSANNDFGGVIIGASSVERHEAGRFGVITLGDQQETSLWKTNDFLEKPGEEIVLPDPILVQVGINFLTVEFLEMMDKEKPCSSGEKRTADGFPLAINKAMKVSAKLLNGDWVDTGTWENWLIANNIFPLYDPT